MKANKILTNALIHLDRRSEQYDSPDGERSIAKVVLLFNSLTGNKISERDGWFFMILLKLVRAQSGGWIDCYEDLAAYAALSAELLQPEAEILQ